MATGVGEVIPQGVASEHDIDTAVSLLQDRVAKLRELSPLWEMYKDGVDLSTIQWTAH